MPSVVVAATDTTMLFNWLALASRKKKEKMKQE